MSPDRLASKGAMWCCATIAAAAMFGTTLTALAKAETLPANLVDLSLEELSNIEITSVSKRPERLSDAAASVFVITAEDIRGDEPARGVATRSQPSCCTSERERICDQRPRIQQ